MPSRDGKRYYNECPKCGQGQVHFTAFPLPFKGAWKADDPLPEYGEDCDCIKCGHVWKQRRKGTFGEIIKS